MQAYTAVLVDRLDKLNQQRVERALSIMDSQSQQVFHLIPVLLHFNHPALPGFNSSAPFGICDFSLNQIQLQVIQDFDDNVELCSLVQPMTAPAQILALYTMGSTSSVGQSSSSDLDIWVCVSPEMPQVDRTHLVNKCLLITEWAKSRGVEANFS